MPPSRSGNLQRNFLLVYWVRRDRETVFLRTVEQPGNVVWSTLDLGPIVRIAATALSVDAGGGVTVTRQATRDAFITSVVEVGAEGPVILSRSQTLDTGTTPLIEAMREAAMQQDRSPRGRRPSRRR